MNYTYEDTKICIEGVEVAVRIYFNYEAGRAATAEEPEEYELFEIMHLTVKERDAEGNWQESYLDGLIPFVEAELIEAIQNTRKLEV